MICFVLNVDPPEATDSRSMLLKRDVLLHTMLLLMHSGIYVIVSFVILVANCFSQMLNRTANIKHMVE